jgi:plasmid maintenance system antidote protein VapI
MMRGPIEERVLKDPSPGSVEHPCITLQPRTPPRTHPPVDPKLPVPSMLRALRRKSGLKKKRFASLLGVHHASNYHVIESGQQKLTLERAVKWSECLGYKPDVLLAAAVRQYVAELTQQDYYVELHPLRKR